MKAKHIFLFLIFLFSLQISAQDRIYFDSAWAVTSKDKMVYYRETTKEKNLTHIKDYYQNGTLQMDALSSNPVVNEEVFEGEAKWFYPNGKLQTLSNYKAGNYFGIYKSYDEEGRLTSDLVYDKENNYDGKNFSFANKDDDYSFNSITEYKNSNTVKTVEFDKDITKLRKETIYSKDYEPTETKYYDDAGKLTGTGSTDENGNVKGIYVDYFANPMRISHFTKYGKENKVEEEKEYYRNGKLKYEYAANKKAASKKFYDQSGKSLGALSSKEVDKDYGMLPYQGVDISFFTESDVIERIGTYNNGKLVLEKMFFPNGKLESVINYGKEEGQISDKTSYEENGSQQYKIIYKDDLPYNGIDKVYNRITTYKEGVVTNQKDLNGSDKVVFEKTLNTATNKYDYVVYGEDLKKKLSFSTLIDDEYGQFNTEISFFQNGKLSGKALIEDGILKSGIITLSDVNGNITYERVGNYLMMKQYNSEKTLVKESKTLIKKSDDYYYDYDLKTFSETDFRQDEIAQYLD